MTSENVESMLKEAGIDVNGNMNYNDFIKKMMINMVRDDSRTKEE